MIVDAQPVATSRTWEVAPLDTPTSTGHTVSQLLYSFLGGLESDSTRKAYTGDLRQYLQWLEERGLDPLAVQRPEADMYAAHLQTVVSTRGKPYGRKTRARKLAAVASFYAYLDKLDVISRDPFNRVTRPKSTDADTPTSTTTERQTRTLLETSRTLRSRALGDRLPAVVLHLMVDLGLRVSEVCSLNRDDLGHRDGLRTLTVRMKGGKVRTRPVPPQLGPMLDDYRTHRPAPANADAEEALFLDTAGNRINRDQIAGMIKRTSQAAGLPQHLTPHSMRHAFNTIARERGAPIEDRRDALGHSSATVTQLYDHAAVSLASDPAHLVATATWTGGAQPQQEGTTHDHD